MAAVSDSPKLIRSVSINKTPNVFPITNPNPEHVTAASLLAARPDFLERVGQALANRYADREEPEEVEMQMYDGFYNSADKHILQKFEHVDWRHRAQLIAKLEDHRLRQLGQRLIYLNAPAYVSDHYVEAAHAAITDRWLSNDPEAPWMTKAEVEKQLGQIAAADALDQVQLSALREFYRKKINTLQI